MKKNKKLAQAEWEIMNEIWRRGRQITVRDVHQLLYSDGQKAYTTVQTTMNILAEKGFLEKEKIGMVNFYRPAVTKEEFAKQETSTLVSRIFQGSFGALANYLIKSDKLSDEEIHKLKKLLDEKERQIKGGGAS